MKPLLHIVRCRGMSLWDQLGLEEALFRADDRNWCVFNVDAPPAVVLGMSSRVEEVVDISVWRQEGMPIIRRFSGGGAVVVDEGTVLCGLIVRVGDIPCCAYPASVMAWTGSVYGRAFACGLRCEEFDYAIGDKKIGGNAQSFAPGRVVHHTSFLWSWSAERMKVLRVPERQPAYRQGRGHEAFCHRLAEFFSSKDELLYAIEVALGELFVCQEATLDEAREVFCRPHRKELRAIVIPAFDEDRQQFPEKWGSF